MTLPVHPSRADGGTSYVGHTLDNRYRLERLIGRGGMGSVYLARHVAIGRQLAVKILDQRNLDDGQGFKRLFREAQTAAGIGHPNIVEVVDVGTTLRGDPYLVMEYLVGEDLSTFIARRGPLPLATAVTILEPILQALHAAHTRGIVHRDLKPSNIYLVRREGAPPTVKLIDFGVAKVMGPSSEGKITVTGALLGTPSYMSPEQAVGMEELDARVDLYAVGVIFYEMVTGTLPFHGANYNELLYRIVRDEVPRPEVPDGSLPDSVCSVIEKSTRKGASERYQTALEMLEAFRNLDAWTGRDLALSELASSIQVAVPESESSGALMRAQASPRLPTSAQTKLSSQADTRADIRASATALAYGTEGRPRSRSGLTAAAAALAIAGLVAVVFMVLANRRNVGGPESGPSAPTSGAAEEGVQITIEGAPDDAQVFYDRSPVPTRQFRVRRSTLVTPIRVELRGYEPFVASVVPREDTIVVVQLEPSPTGTASGGEVSATPNAAPPTSAGKPGHPPAPHSAPDPGIGKLGRDTYYTEDFE
jgi:serine/threonine protein kinase